MYINTYSMSCFNSKLVNTEHGLKLDTTMHRLCQLIQTSSPFGEILRYSLTSCEFSITLMLLVSTLWCVGTRDCVEVGGGVASVGRCRQEMQRVQVSVGRCSEEVQQVQLGDVTSIGKCRQRCREYSEELQRGVEVGGGVGSSECK